MGEVDSDGTAPGGGIVGGGLGECWCWQVLLVVVCPWAVCEVDGGDLFEWVCYPRIFFCIVFVATDAVVLVIPLGFGVVSMETVKFGWGV